MKFSEAEIEKAKELRRLKLIDRIENFKFRPGQYIWARECPMGCVDMGENIFLITSNVDQETNLIWLPTTDELLEILPRLGLSFSHLTDYLHRRRFADGKAREGMYQLLIEKLR